MTTFTLIRQYLCCGFALRSSVFLPLLSGAQVQSNISVQKAFLFLEHALYFLFFCNSLTLPNDYWLVPSYAWSIAGMMILQKPMAVQEKYVFFFFFNPFCKLLIYSQQIIRFSLNPSSTFYGRVGKVVSALSLLLVAYGLVSIYRIQYFVTAAVVIYAASKHFL